MADGPVCSSCLSWLNDWRLQRRACPSCGHWWPAEKGSGASPGPGMDRGLKTTLQPVSRGPICGNCRVQPALISGMLAVGPYDGPLKQGINRLKFGGKPYLARPLAALMLAAAVGIPTLYPVPGRMESSHWVLVAVPLSNGRARERGYNQSGLLTLEVGRALSLEIGSPLSKTREVPPQARLGRPERLQNLRGAFTLEVGATALLAGRSVLLVDDVTTTGATLRECAAVLLGGGAREVWALTLASGQV